MVQGNESHQPTSHPRQSNDARHQRSDGQCIWRSPPETRLYAGQWCATPDNARPFPRGAELKLSKLSIANFQSVSNAIDIEFGQITYLIGPNSVGKSSIFDALDLVSDLGRMKFDSAFSILRSSIRSGGSEPVTIKLSSRFETEDYSRLTDKIPTTSEVFIDESSDYGSNNNPVRQKSEAQAKRRWHQFFGSFFNQTKPKKLDFEIQLTGTGEIERLLISIDDERLLDYERSPTLWMNPYFEVITEESHCRTYPSIPSIFVQGRCFISGSLLDQAGKFLEYAKKSRPSARARAILQSDESGVTAYGLSCTGLRSQNEFKVGLSSKAASLCELPLIDWLIASCDISALEVNQRLELPSDMDWPNWRPVDSEVDQAIAVLLQRLYFPGVHERVEIDVGSWAEPTVKWLIAEHILKNYRIEEPKKARVVLDEFLKNEEHDNLESTEALRSALEELSVLLEVFVSGALQLAGEAAARRHVPGDRTRISSETLHNIKPWTETSFGLIFQPSIAPASNSLNLPSGAASGASGNQLLADLALEIARQANEDMEDDELPQEILEIVNRMADRDMRSISRFKYRSDVYRIKRVADYGKPGDNCLDSHLLIRFYLEDSFLDNARRGFEEVGSGLSFVFPILASLVLDKQLISIEQPELHLHPHAQQELLNLMVRTGRQIVLETHSDTFLHAMSALLKANAGRPQYSGENVTHIAPAPKMHWGDFKINYLTAGSPSEGAGLQSRTIRMAADGTLLDDWPSDFTWKGVSPAFIQIGVYGQDFAVGSELSHIDWMRNLPETAITCLKTAWIAATKDDWDIWTMYAAKLQEHLLNDRVEGPFVKECRELLEEHSFFKRKMTVGHWIDYLGKTGGPQEDPVIQLLAEWMSKTDWAGDWNTHRREFLKHSRKLIEVRNKSAHKLRLVGGEDIDKFGLRTFLIDGDRQPGMIFKALGMGQVRRPSPDGIALFLATAPRGATD